jgi:hypothetical protein
MPGSGPIDPDLSFTYNGAAYLVDREKYAAAGIVELPDGTLVRGDVVDNGLVNVVEVPTATARVA